eukprot:Gb_00768 [translate_table: standard]
MASKVPERFESRALPKPTQTLQYFLASSLDMVALQCRAVTNKAVFKYLYKHGFLDSPVLRTRLGFSLHVDGAPATLSNLLHVTFIQEVYSTLKFIVSCYRSHVLVKGTGNGEGEPLLTGGVFLIRIATWTIQYPA